MPNFNPLNPTKFTGTNKYIVFTVSRNRQPTTQDYRQPETGTLYSIGTLWQVGKNPTTGTEGDLWLLSKIVANQGYWILVNGSPSAATQFDMQTGISPVLPNGSGLVTFNGLAVTAGTNPVRTDGTSVNTMALEVQISQAIASTNANNIGLAAFNSSHFTVDVNGFVSLAGGGQTVDSLQVDVFTGPGTNPVVPNASGLISITGAQVASGVIGTNVVRSNSLAINSFSIEIQQSNVNATKDISKNGVAHFNDNQFTNDQGFISLKGGGPTNASFFSATISADILNVTGDNTSYFIIFNTESFDVNSNYNTSTGIFTAPVNGYYQFLTSLLLGGLTSSHETGKFNFTVNAAEAGSSFRGNFFRISDAGNNLSSNASCILQLNAGDQVQVLLQVDGSIKDVDILQGGGMSLSNFQGYIIREIP